MKKTIQSLFLIMALILSCSISLAQSKADKEIMEQVRGLPFVSVIHALEEALYDSKVNVEDKELRTVYRLIEKRDIDENKVEVNNRKSKKITLNDLVEFFGGELVGPKNIQETVMEALFEERSTKENVEEIIKLMKSHQGEKIVQESPFLMRIFSEFIRVNLLEGSGNETERSKLIAKIFKEGLKIKASSLASSESAKFYNFELKLPSDRMLENTAQDIIGRLNSPQFPENKETALMKLTNLFRNQSVIMRGAALYLLLGGGSVGGINSKKVKAFAALYENVTNEKLPAKYKNAITSNRSLDNKNGEAKRVLTNLFKKTMKSVSIKNKCEKSIPN